MKFLFIAKHITELCEKMDDFCVCIGSKGLFQALKIANRRDKESQCETAR